ncbi:hypothetical protein TH5_00800 [Thalassospira xianhensis MCCC 1A02616]|uniref:Uncharacterized protein n=2 Tax=Thalassospira xianhensis TaxID=478503 RepID=A0A367UH67_9PROT|nr:hypothetical protein TH5_00800 [Thalassospira xianhensis MCCC 1A02616]
MPIINVSTGTAERNKKYRTHMEYSSHSTVNEFVEELKDFYDMEWGGLDFSTFFLPTLWQKVEAAQPVAIACLRSHFPDLPLVCEGTPVPSP